METDKDLVRVLTGTLAVQLGMATPKQVLWAWKDDGGMDLSERLEKSGVISSGQREALQQQVAEMIRREAGQLQRTQPVVAESTEETLRAEGPRSLVDAETEELLTKLALGFEQRYRIESVVGKGGQARVFKAVDQLVGRDIAMKEMLPLDDREAGDSADSKQANRFLREARITAGLAHPNIVPVHEMGRRPDGALYYTMQLVRGQTLHRKLDQCESLEDRLDLLRSVWDVSNALAFAHSQGVIHRDIKPQNIMVGPFGETVVLDWGVAKVKDGQALRDDEIRERARALNLTGGETVEGSMLGTPSYMSPEQAQGRVEEIDERSDVWGLGALLYKVLTGNPPHPGDSLVEIIENICNQPVRPVEEVSPGAPAELAAIAEKALRIDRSQRYRNAQEVAEEISAYMTGRRVRAYTYSSWDLLRRFIARYRVAVTVGAVAGLLLLVVGVVAFFQVRAERDLAEQQRDAARRFANLMVSDIFDQVEPLAGSTPALATLVNTALDYYQKLGQPELGSVQDRFDLARSHRKLGYVADLTGKTSEAHQAYDRAARVLASLARERPDDPKIQEALAATYNRLGLVAIAQKDRDLAMKHLAAGLKIAEPLAAAQPEDFDVQSRLMMLLKAMGEISLDTGRLAEARAHHQRHMKLAERMLSSAPEERQRIQILRYAYGNLARVAEAEGKISDARALQQKALAMSERMVAQRPEDGWMQRSLMVDHLRLGQLAMSGGNLTEAEDMFRLAAGITRRLAGADPANVGRQRDYAACLHYLSMVEEERGYRDRALETYRKVLSISRRLQALAPKQIERHSDVAATLQRMGDLARAIGRISEARDYYQQGLAVIEPTAKNAPEQIQFGQILAASRMRLGDLAWIQGKPEQARTWFQKSLAEGQRIFAQGPKQAVSAWLLPQIQQRDGQYQRAAELMQKLVEADPTGAENTAQLLEAQVLAGLYQKASTLAEKALTLNRQRREACVVLCLLLIWAETFQDHSVRAAEYARQAIALLRNLSGGPSLEKWSPVPARMVLLNLKHRRVRDLRSLFAGLQGWSHGAGSKALIKALLAFKSAP